MTRGSSRLLVAILLCLAVSSAPLLVQGYVWTNEWLHPLGCVPYANGSAVNLTNTYALCPDSATNARMTLSEQPAIFQNATNSLPEYLVPIYDITCTNAQPTSFLGHILILYSQRQMLLIGFFPAAKKYYDCHASEWVDVVNGTLRQLKTIRLDTAPVSVGVLGTSNLNTSNPLQFNNLLTIQGDDTNGTVLGNWTIDDPQWFTKTSAQWFFSAEYTLTIFSNQTRSNRTITLTVGGGMNLQSCLGNPLIKDAPTCVVLNRQIRSFGRPTVLPMNASSIWTATDSQWPLPLQEQCQQIHVYDSSAINASQVPPQTSVTRGRVISRPFSCVNPLIRKMTPANSSEWANLFTVVTILPAPLPESSPVPSPIPSPVPSPVVVVPVNGSSPAVTPSPLMATPLEENSSLTTTPPAATPMEAVRQPMTTPIIVLIVVLAILVVAIIVSSVGISVIRKNLKKKLEESEIVSINKQSCLYAFCCLKVNSHGFLDSAYDMADEERIHIKGNNHILLSESETPRTSMADRELQSGYLDAISDQLASEEFQLPRKITPPSQKTKKREDDDEESLFM